MKLKFNKLKQQWVSSLGKTQSVKSVKNRRGKTNVSSKWFKSLSNEPNARDRQANTVHMKCYSVQRKLIGRCIQRNRTTSVHIIFQKGFFLPKDGKREGEIFVSVKSPLVLITGKSLL